MPLGIAIASSRCYVLRPTRGGGMTEFVEPRRPSSADVALPSDYVIEQVADGFTFPTSVTFDDQGRPCLVESGYAYGEVFTTPRLIRIEADGARTTIAEGGRNGPWNGVVFDQGDFFVAEGGTIDGGRILRITPEGSITALIEHLPSQGDHHVNGPAIGPDGWIYFGIGAATNSGVVGEDSAAFGWLRRHPDFHDVPGMTITLAGRNFETEQPLTDDRSDEATTGAFLPFGTASTPGQVIEGRVPCTAAVLRIPREGGAPELVAWGLRNPFGLAFAPDGRLFVTDNGYDERGSRPVWGAADLLWSIVPGTWYGWPDYSGDQPLAGDVFDSPSGPEPEALLAKAPGTPPKPVAQFDCHSSADGLDFSRNEEFGHVGEAFVALFGDQAPATGKVLAPMGFKVVRVDVERGVIHEFAVNRGDKNGPASLRGTNGLERPVAVRFDRAGTALYVVDFGVLLQDGKQARPQQATGSLWKVTRSSALAANQESGPESPR